MSHHVEKNLSNVKEEVQTGGKCLRNEKILLGKWYQTKHAVTSKYISDEYQYYYFHARKKNDQELYNTTLFFSTAV